MTPEEITKWRNSVRVDSGKIEGDQVAHIEIGKLDALLEIALQLAEMNAREDAKNRIYKASGFPLRPRV